MAYGALVILQFISSGWHVLCSIIIGDTISPLIFTFYREIIAAVFMYAIAIFFEGRFRTPRLIDVGRLTFLGLLNYVSILGYTLGFRYTSANTVAIYQSAIPVFTAALGFWVKQEIWDKIKFSGIMIAALGALVATVGTTSKNHGHGSQVVLGNLLLLCQTIALSVFLVLQRPLLYRYSHTWVVAWGYTSALVFCALSAFYYVDHHTNWSIKGKNEDLSLLYAAVIVSGVGQNLMAWGNMITKSTIVATFTTLQPVLIAIIYFPVHKSNELAIPVIIGGIVALLGIVITCWRYQQILALNYESDNPIFSRLIYKNATFDREHSESSVSQSTRTKQSIHHFTPSDLRNIGATGYSTSMKSDGQDRLRAATETLRISRIISNESQAQGLRKATKCSTSSSHTANRYTLASFSELSKT